MDDALERFAVAESTFVLRRAVHVAQQLHVAWTLLDLAARKHPLLRGDHHLGEVSSSGQTACSIIYEARHVAGHKKPYIMLHTPMTFPVNIPVLMAVLL
ncbi:MAG: hypothetical protein R3C56_27065 [Pirellulaceae bacterium]